MRTITLLAGKYYGGMDVPFLATHAMIQDAVNAAVMVQAGKAGWDAVGKKEGLLRNFSWHKRSDNDPPPVDPNADPNYSDKWNEWFSCDYVGPDLVVDLPDALAWLLAIPTGPPRTTQIQPNPPDPGDLKQNPPTWAQPGSQPVPPLPLPEQQTQPGGSNEGGPDSWWLLLLLYLATRKTGGGRRRWR